VLLLRCNFHPLHYIIQCWLFPDKNHLEKYRKKLEILVLSYVWVNHYGSDVTLIYQERMFNSEYFIDASIHFQERKLRLEVNEKGHQGYNQDSEIRRHSIIKSMSINVIIFDGTDSTHENINSDKLNEFLSNVDAGIRALSFIDMEKFKQIIDVVERKSSEVGQAFSNVIGKTIFSSGYPLTRMDVVALDPWLDLHEGRNFRTILSKYEDEKYVLMITRAQLYEMVNKIHLNIDEMYYREKRLIWIYREEFFSIAENNRIEAMTDDVIEEVLVKTPAGWKSLPFVRNEEVAMVIVNIQEMFHYSYRDNKVYLLN